MRILVINYEYPPIGGGGGFVTRDILEEIVKKGHTVTVLIPPWDDPKNAGQSWDDAGVKVVNVALPPAIPLLFHILLTIELNIIFFPLLTILGML